MTERYNTKDIMHIDNHSQEYIAEGNRMAEENKENCNFQQNYNVFGLDDKPCCYLYHKYCEEIDDCHFKRCKRLEQERDEWKAELHSKVEFIQEQRTIINNYEKEIEMYEKCQGKRASKREKELENDLDNLLIKYAGCKTANTAIQEENKKLISALEEIRILATKNVSIENFVKIQNKINEILNS